MRWIFALVLLGAAVAVWAVRRQGEEQEKETTEQKEDTSMEFVTRPSGLKYHVEKDGTGETTAKPGEVVEVHYTGWLDDGGAEGTKFDSSVDRGRPFSFVVGAGQVIKGWDETLLEMREGEVRYIILPPELGYGARGAGASIPPNATLRFRVELLKIAP